jgi:hypothetical protein
MSKGNDSRTQQGRTSESRTTRDTREREPRTSRSSIAMTAERARAIQSQADRTGRNEEFKVRAMSAAARNEAEKAAEDEE